MAKFTPGPTVAEVRGSIGGTVYSRNRYGAYMRFRAKPTVSTTAHALAAKARMTQMTQAWQNLTAAQRLSWNQWANATPIVGALGESQQLTGHAAFVGVNCRLDCLAAAPITAPPITPAPAPLGSLGMTPDKTAGTCFLAYTPTPIGAAERLWITATQQPSAGKTWVENLLKGLIYSGLAEVSPFDAITGIEGRIGALVIGQTLHIKCFVIDNATGLLSAPLRQTAVVV